MIPFAIALLGTWNYTLRLGSSINILTPIRMVKGLTTSGITNPGERLLGTPSPDPSQLGAAPGIPKLVVIPNTGLGNTPATRMHLMSSGLHEEPKLDHGLKCFSKSVVRAMPLFVLNGPPSHGTTSAETAGLPWNQNNPMLSFTISGPTSHGTSCAETAWPTWEFKTKIPMLSFTLSGPTSHGTPSAETAWPTLESKVHCLSKFPYQPSVDLQPGTETRTSRPCVDCLDTRASCPTPLGINQVDQCKQKIGENDCLKETSCSWSFEDASSKVGRNPPGELFNTCKGLISPNGYFINSSLGGTFEKHVENSKTAKIPRALVLTVVLGQVCMSDGGALAVLTTLGATFLKPETIWDNLQSFLKEQITLGLWKFGMYSYTSGGPESSAPSEYLNKNGVVPQEENAPSERPSVGYFTWTGLFVMIVVVSFASWATFRITRALFSSGVNVSQNVYIRLRLLGEI